MEKNANIVSKNKQTIVDSNLVVVYFQSPNVCPTSEANSAICRKQFSKIMGKNCIRGKSKGKGTCKSYDGSQQTDL